MFFLHIKRTGFSQPSPNPKKASAPPTWQRQKLIAQQEYFLDGINAMVKLWVPSGKSLHSYWKWPFIVSFPINNGDFP